ncbi:MAG: trypsin-like peptidase domain-containing protein [Gordonia sp. (in: high G+C Gram-positive bacteria)]|uniref:S1 family peptidase n=1 Tax=Gordonia sp. (in: high G+C Gram-positive bacteria) TaxID=84139 RepID=UPI0039E3316C
MRLISRILALTTAALLITVGAGPVHADPDGPSIASRIGPSLVYIQTDFKGSVTVPIQGRLRETPELTLTTSCTGYVVDETGFIATAGHCVNAQDDQLHDGMRARAAEALGQTESDAAQIARLAIEQRWPVRMTATSSGAATSVRVRQPTGEDQLIADWRDVQVISFQPFEQGDNAVLRLNDVPEGLTALVLSDRVPEPGEDVISAGFPGAVQRTNDSSAIAQPSYKTGTVSSRQNSDSGVYRTEISATLGKGMSGGPTVDEESRVIGTNSSGAALMDEKASFNFITDNIALRDYLTQNGVTLAAAPSDRDAGGVPLWFWLGPLIGVGVLLIAVALWLLLRRKSASGTVDPRSGPTGPGMPGPGMPMPPMGQGSIGAGPAGPGPRGPDPRGRSPQGPPGPGGRGARPGPQGPPGGPRPGPPAPGGRGPVPQHGPQAPGVQGPGAQGPGTQGLRAQRPGAPQPRPNVPPQHAPVRQAGAPGRPSAPARPGPASGAAQHPSPLPGEQETVLNQPLPDLASAAGAAGETAVPGGSPPPDEGATVLDQPLPKPSETDSR